MRASLIRLQPILAGRWQAAAGCAAAQSLHDPPYIIVFKNEFHNNGCVIVRKYGMFPEAARRRSVGNRRSAQAPANR